MSVDVTEVQQALGGIDYPAAKETILEHAETRGTRDEVLQHLRNIPPRTYDAPTSVMEELKGELGG